MDLRSCATRESKSINFVGIHNETQTYPQLLSLPILIRRTTVSIRTQSESPGTSVPCHIRCIVPCTALRYDTRHTLIIAEFSSRRGDTLMRVVHHVAVAQPEMRKERLRGRS